MEKFDIAVMFGFMRGIKSGGRLEGGKRWYYIVKAADMYDINGRGQSASWFGLI